MGLNDDFNHARSHAYFIAPPPAINKAFSLIVQQEQHQSTSKSNSSLTLAAQKTNPSPSPYPPQSQPNSNQNPPYNTKRSNKNRPMCTYCHLPGHTIDKCYKLHGYPPGRQKAEQIIRYTSRHQIIHLLQIRPQKSLKRHLQVPHWTMRRLPNVTRFYPCYRRSLQPLRLIMNPSLI